MNSIIGATLFYKVPCRIAQDDDLERSVLLKVIYSFYSATRRLVSAGIYLGMEVFSYTAGKPP